MRLLHVWETEKVFGPLSREEREIYVYATVALGYILFLLTVDEFLYSP